MCTPFAVSLAALSLGLTLAAPQTGQPMPKQMPMAKPAAESAFIKQAAEGGMAEVELAEVAETHAANADVKALATKIKTDHEQANAELKTLAMSKGVTLPTEPTPAQKATRDRLSKLQGAAFDRAYVADMVTDHRKDVAAFTTKTKSTDPDVKAFAEKTLPTLKDHLQRAEALQKVTTGKVR